MHKKSNESGLKEALELYLKHFKLLNGYHQAAIVSIWDRLMGAVIATKTEKISYKDGLLSIRFSSPVLRQEMQFVKEKIKDSLNKELGKKVIQEVKIL